MTSDSADDKFNLVFRGQLAKGVDLAVVKRNLGQLFKIDAGKVEAMFSGKPVVLKRGLSSDAANKYRVAIKKAGALVELVVDAPIKPRGKASFGVPAQAASTPSTVPDMGAIPGTESGLGVIPGTQSADAAGSEGKSGIRAPNWQLAPLGADLLQPQEKPHQPPVEVDTSDLSLRDTAGNLLDDSEYTEAVEVSLDLGAYDLTEAGADVLRPEERKPLLKVDIDISGLSLGKAGETLAPSKPTPPPAPDVSKISLQD